MAASRQVPHGYGPASRAPCWPGYVACLVVLASRKPRKGLTAVPLRGGDRREDLPFERKTLRGCSDSAYRRPLEFRGCESKRRDARCAQGHKHCSYVLVDSFQITGGRTTPGKHPVAPAAATNLRLPSQSRSVSSIKFPPKSVPKRSTTARILAELLAAYFKNRELSGGDRHDPGGMGGSRASRAKRPSRPRETRAGRDACPGTDIA
jgi:hypothetical protein